MKQTFLLDSPLGDPAIDGIVQNETNFNVDFGFSYHYLDFYAHATVKNILKNKGVNTDIDPLNQTDNLRRYLLSIGYVFNKYGSEWSYEPSVMIQYRDATKEGAIDVNAKVYKQMDFGKLWGGLSYRNSFDGAEYLTNIGSVKSQKLQQFTPIIGVNYNQFMFAYNYTYQANSVVFTNGGYHQFTLGYNFDCKRKAFRVQLSSS